MSLNPEEQQAINEGVAAATALNVSMAITEDAKFCIVAFVQGALTQQIVLDPNALSGLINKLKEAQEKQRGMIARPSGSDVRNFGAKPNGG